MTPSQPPPSQGEGPIESLTNISEQFTLLQRGELTPTQPPFAGVGLNEDLLSTTEQFPPLRRGGLGWGLCRALWGSLAPLTSPSTTLPNYLLVPAGRALDVVNAG